jgi:hypothetical protein
MNFAPTLENSDASFARARPAPARAATQTRIFAATLDELAAEYREVASKIPGWLTAATRAEPESPEALSEFPGPEPALARVAANEGMVAS